ncbi:MAG: hypothetical protein HBSIN02_17800 [Bacteroidia bacterium]|nr:MAG: hypothetical protein HBSIN02_17800 [Bacteroidia bacterium]
MDWSGVETAENTELVLPPPPRECEESEDHERAFHDAPPELWMNELEGDSPPIVANIGKWRLNVKPTRGRP